MRAGDIRRLALVFALILLALADAGQASAQVTSVAAGPCVTVSPTTGAVVVSGSAPINPQTGTSYTLAASDQCKLVTFSNTSSVGVTLNAPSTYAAGWSAALKNIGNGVVTVATSPSTITIDGQKTLVLNRGDWKELWTDGSNYYTTGSGNIFINVKDFGAYCDGATDDTTALQNAVATGFSVWVPAGCDLYLNSLSGLTNSAITFSAVGQRLVGAGRMLSEIKVRNASGNFNVLEFTGNDEGVEDIGFDLSGMASTGQSDLHGYAFYLSGAGRFDAKRIYLLEPWNVAYVVGTLTQMNDTMTFEDLWADDIEGYYGFNWDCTSVASNLLMLARVTVPFDANTNSGFTRTGVEDNGQCQSLILDRVGTNSATYGLHAEGTGTNVPSFIHAFNFAEDHPAGNFIQLDEGNNFYFFSTYGNGAGTANSGVSVGSGVSDVSFLGGKITGFGVDGFDVSGSHVMIGGGIEIGDNANYGVNAKSGALDVKLSGIDWGPATRNQLGNWFDQTGLGNGLGLWVNDAQNGPILPSDGAIGGWPAVEAAAKNYLSWPEDFTQGSVWTPSNSTVAGVSNPLAPNGLPIADTIQEDSSNNAHDVKQTVSSFPTSSPLSYSAYLQAGNRLYGELYALDASGTVHAAIFSLQGSGAIGNTTNVQSPFIVSLPSGWYRVGFTFTNTSGSSAPVVRVRPALNLSTTSYAGCSCNAIYVWGAQVENNPAISSYIAGSDLTQSRVAGRINPQAVPWGESYYQAPSTGFSITVPYWAENLILHGTATIASGTVTMPAYPVDNQIARIVADQAVTSLTVDANSGQSINGGGAISILANSTLAWRYNAANTVWYSLQSGTLPGGVMVGTGTPVTKIVVYSQSITPASVPADKCAEQTFTVTGLATSDKVVVNPPASGNATSAAQSRVSAANTLAQTYCNPTSGALTPASGTYNIVAIRS
jgi:hypothetical protein